MRNIIRQPRRTFLTALGVAAAVAILIAFVGIIDSLLATLDLADEAVDSGDRERVEVDLQNFYSGGGPRGSRRDLVASRDLVRADPPGARVPRERDGAEDILAIVTVQDLVTGDWAPQNLDGTEPEAGLLGIYLSELASRDLGVRRGDTVTLRHPVPGPLGTVALRSTALEVLGTHTHPFRFVAYMDSSLAADLGLAGLVNHVIVEPVEGMSLGEVKRDLSRRQGVAFVQGAKETTDGVRDGIGDFIGIFRVIQGAVIFLAVLIAFNRPRSTSMSGRGSTRPCSRTAFACER